MLCPPTTHLLDFDEPPPRPRGPRPRIVRLWPRRRNGTSSAAVSYS
jgi:hypothetical protein